MLKISDKAQARLIREAQDQVKDFGIQWGEYDCVLDYDPEDLANCEPDTEMSGNLICTRRATGAKLNITLDVFDPRTGKLILAGSNAGELWY